MKKKRKNLAVKKRTILLKNRKRTNKTTQEKLERTDKQEQAMRQKAYEFLYFASVRDLRTLHILGYESEHDISFIKFHGLGNMYMTNLVMNKSFKQEYFDYVTSKMSRDFHKYLRAVVSTGKEKVKGLQILLPEQVGVALAQRKIGLTGDHDDEDFRNTFFGFKNKAEE